MLVVRIKRENLQDATMNNQQETNSISSIELIDSRILRDYTRGAYNIRDDIVQVGP